MVVCMLILCLDHYMCLVSISREMLLIQLVIVLMVIESPYNWESEKLLQMTLAIKLIVKDLSQYNSYIPTAKLSFLNSHEGYRNCKDFGVCITFETMASVEI